MEAEQAAEWRELLTRVESSLRLGASLLRRGGRVARVVQVVVMPSFASWVSSEVYSIDAGDMHEFVAARTVWDLGADAARLASPVERLRHPRVLEPTLIHSQAALPLDVGRRIVSEVAGMNVPAAPVPSSIGLDGTRYSMALGQGAAEPSMGWWESPPDHWAAAGRLARSVIEAVDAAIQRVRDGGA